MSRPLWSLCKEKHTHTHIPYTRVHLRVLEFFQKLIHEPCDHGPNDARLWILTQIFDDIHAEVLQEKISGVLAKFYIYVNHVRK